MADEPVVEAYKDAAGHEFAPSIPFQKADGTIADPNAPPADPPADPPAA